MENDKFIIFTDGSSRGNPGPGGFGAVVICDENVKELGGGEKETTNNRMEIMAVIEALKFVKNSGSEIEVFTDSSYLINGITKWVYGWQKNGWKTKTKEEVLNRDLWEKLFSLVSNFKIEWKHVGGHIGIVGNERCDEIATAFADGEQPNLYDGPISKYKIDILNFEKDSGLVVEKKEKKNRSNKPAYSYVSLIDGVVETYKSWAECEKRVKGAKGAKYKKVFSEIEEKELILEWGKNKK